MEYNGDMESSVDTLKGHIRPQVKRLQALAYRKPDMFKAELKKTQELLEKPDATVERLEYRLKRNRDMMRAFSKPKSPPKSKKPTLWTRLIKRDKAA